MSDYTSTDFENMALDALSDHIVNVHHAYCRKAIPALKEKTARAADSLGNTHPELVNIAGIFEEMAKALEEHFAGEEKYLFPYVKKMLNAKKEGTKIPKPGFGSLEGPLKNHVDDHDHAWNLMQEIKKLGNGFKLPAGAGDSLKALYKQLDEFEKDLKQHIYLENEVLFGRSMELEKDVVE